MKISKVRDLTLVKIDEHKTLVIACDSCGGVGMKEGDALKVSPRITGKFTARVALFEVLCAGAEVVCLTNNVCNEMDDTGQQVRKGIIEELEAAGVDQIVLTGSTEENFPTISTGIGITVLGIAASPQLKVNQIHQDAALVVIGQPKVGTEILACQPGEIVDYNTIRYLLAQPEVCEIVPVGSKGIYYEAQQLAECNDVQLILKQDIKPDIKKSAGPCSTILVAVKEAGLASITALPYSAVIGKIVQKNRL
ncbi:hypothetical protein SPFL3102_031334 [Sporomusaceae bacterium FL31]|nr:hypothetical protein SPFL3101_00910 [Sporomusaceae bacterium FL31]GCE35298.1 hypothetical protein SPFL3102_031334 [Sporomusaceae bacterium]